VCPCGTVALAPTGTPTVTTTMTLPHLRTTAPTATTKTIKTTKTTKTTMKMALKELALELVLALVQTSRLCHFQLEAGAEAGAKARALGTVDPPVVGVGVAVAADVGAGADVGVGVVEPSPGAWVQLVRGGGWEAGVSPRGGKAAVGGIVVGVLGCWPTWLR
jgi:hypothetical protein